jgi:hypothetical protein
VNHLRIDCRVHIKLCEGSGDGRRTKQEKQPQPAVVCGSDMARAQLGRKLVVLHQDHSESAMVGRHCWASSELHRLHLTFLPKLPEISNDFGQLGLDNFGEGIEWAREEWI